MDIYTPNDTDVIHSTKVDFKKRTIQETVHIVQFDKSLPVVAVTLMYNGYSYTAPNSAEVWIRWGKRDHTYVYKKCMISADRKTVYFDVDYQMTVIHGELNPILELIIGAKSAGSSPIPVVIDKNPIQDGDIESRVEDSTVAELRGEDLRLHQEINDVDARKQDKLTFDSTPTAGSQNPVTSEGIKNAIADAQAHGIYNYKGEVADYAHLPTLGVAIGDVWEAADTGINWAWNGTSWDNKGTGFKAQLNLVLTQRGYKHATDNDDGRELEVAKALQADEATESKLADNLKTDRQIDNPEDSCPPITMGITGGDAEIKSGTEAFEYMEGKSEKFNQLVQNGNFANGTAGWSSQTVTGFSVSNKIATFTATAQDGNISSQGISTPRGHKIYFSCDIKLATPTTGVQVGARLNYTNTAATTDWQRISSITSADPNNSGNIFVWIADKRTSGWDAIQVKNVMLIDLTRIYGPGNEPTTVEQFKKDYPAAYYAYNAGTILSSKSASLISRRRQQWDGALEIGNINGDTGEDVANNSTRRSVGYTTVIAGETYHFNWQSFIQDSSIAVMFYDINKNFLNAIYFYNRNYDFVVPANASFIRFRIYHSTWTASTTVAPDITISVFWSDGEGYDKYYPYEAQEVVLPNIELRSVPDNVNGGEIKDIAYVKGGGKRRVGIIDLGSLNWSFATGGFSAPLLDAIEGKGNRIDNIICSKYQAIAGNEQYNQTKIGICLGGNGVGLQGNVRVCDTAYTDAVAFKSAMSGVYLLYELAEETDIPLTENPGWDTNVIVDNYGTLEFVTNPQQIPQIPQPYFIKYTINLKEFLDGAYTKANGNPQNIVVKEELDQEVENFEKGTKVAGKAQVAENLTPYNDESGTSQSIPFINQGTGCGNGESAVDTGSYAELRNKNGNTVVVNQLVNWSNDVPTTSWSYGAYSITNKKITVVVNAREGIISGGVLPLDFKTIVGHKYLVLSSLSNTEGFFLYDNNTTQTMHFNTITTASYSSLANMRLNFYAGNGLAEQKTSTFTLICIDLTLWFGSNDNIPPYLLDHPENFFRYYQGSLAYNEGTPVNANGQFLKCIVRNIWDEVAESGYYDPATGTAGSNANYTRGKNFIPVTPNAQYCMRIPSSSNDNYVLWHDKDKNFIRGKWVGAGNNVVTAPANACYAHIYFKEATYGNDVTFSLYYEGESGYDQYYPHKVLARVDTGTEVLRSAGNVHDSKAPDGTITRRIGVVDLGSLNWTYRASGGAIVNSTFQSTSLKDLVKHKTARADALCSKYTIGSWNEVGFQSGIDKMISVANDGFLNVADSTAGTDAEAFKSAMSGVYLLYELAEPTTEQGTPYAENVKIDDFGSMMWEGDDFNGVPQGCDIFYPVDYKASLDTLIKHTDGNMESIVLDADLQESEQVRDAVDSQLKNALGGTLRQCLCVKENLDFDNTAFVDLGELKWTYYATSPSHFSATLIGVKVGTAKILCTKYKAIASGGGSSLTVDKTINIHNGSTYVQIKDDAYTDATAFKNAMKGVLLAYEKASS